MSEEELKVIERFKKIKEETDIANRCGLSTNDFKEDLETYDAILNLIEKQQKENKYLRDENNIYRNETVSKYKIRNKIKELENMRDTSITSESFNIFNGEIIVLKELLGE